MTRRSWRYRQRYGLEGNPNLRRKRKGGTWHYVAETGLRWPDQTDGKAVSTSGTKAAMHQRGTVMTGRASNTGLDDDERQPLRDVGPNLDGPAVIAAIDLVRWELSLGA